MGMVVVEVMAEDYEWGRLCVRVHGYLEGGI